MAARPPCLQCGRPLPAVYRREVTVTLVADSVCDFRKFDSGAAVRCQLKPELVDGRSRCAAGHVSAPVHTHEYGEKKLIGHGRRADGMFCTDSCGIVFARAAARAGYRLVKAPAPPASRKAAGS